MAPGSRSARGAVTAGLDAMARKLSATAKYLVRVVIVISGPGVRCKQDGRVTFRKGGSGGGPMYRVRLTNAQQQERPGRPHEPGVTSRTRSRISSRVSSGDFPSV